MSVKVRFAPSPTGYLHVGSARTALFNWLFARHEGGEFMLRIEDTDQSRSKDEFLEEILESIQWLGLNWDGELVYQSQRIDRHREVAEQLLSDGKAYKDGDAILYKVGAERDVPFEDVIRGKISISTEQIKDQVLIKSDGSPAYNFACVVDDSDLGLTHVIRGDDHISNTPKQLLLYEALGLEPPKFAHIPLILGPDKSRLSKRHGATSIREYRNQGYLPECLINYLSLLGWSPGDDKEILPLEEIVELFTLERVGKNGAVFDHDKFEWMNNQYLQKVDAKSLMPLVQEALTRRGWWREDLDIEWVETMVDIFKSRTNTIEDFCDQAEGLFTDNIPWDEKAVEKRLKQEGAAEHLVAYADKLEALPEWTCEAIEQACRSLAEALGIKAADLIHPSRVAVSGKGVGPSVFHLLEVAGQERTVRRLREAAQTVCVG